MSNRALHEFTIVDCSRTVAGAFCTKILAGLGARVIKVEPPGGEPLRHIGPFKNDFAHIESSGLFHYLNTDKQSIVLDPGSPIRDDVLRKLIKLADVYIFDTDASCKDNHLFSQETARAINDRIVVTEITAFGDGPYHKFVESDLALAALAGWLALTGEPDRNPLKARGHMIGACVPGLYAAIATLAGLWERDNSNQGQGIEVSKIEALLSTSRFYETTLATQGLLYGRAGTQYDHSFPCGIFRCKDGYITLVASQEAWELLCSLIGLEDLMGDERFSMAKGRVAHRQYLEERMSSWLMEHTRQQCFHLFQEARIIAGMVCSANEVMSLEQYRARSFFRTLVHPICGEFEIPGPMAHLYDTPWRVDDAGPMLGEHTEAILRELSYEPGASLQLFEREAVCGDVQNSTAPVGLSAGSTPTPPVKQGPLHGLRVLDLTTYMAGPFAAMAFADLGAEVIKIEAIQRVDSWRVLLAAEGAREPWESSPLFQAQHRNKLGITLDLNSPDGKEIFKKLVARSDVVVENFSARVMPNFGLGYDVLKEINPGVIMLSLTGLGSTGPWKDYISMAQVGESIGGIYAITGYEDGHLSHHTPMPADPASGLTAAAAILAALHYRRRTGVGQYIEVAQAEVIASIAADCLVDYTLNGRVWQPVGNRDSSMAPHNVYPCCGDDQWVAIVVRTDAEWQALRTVIGDPEWAHSEEFASVVGRFQHQHRIDEGLTAWTSLQDASKVMERLQAVGVSAGVVQGPRDLLIDPHLNARAYWRFLARGDDDALPIPSTPMRFSRSVGADFLPAPRLGEHNHHVFESILGLTQEEIASLEERRVIGNKPITAS